MNWHELALQECIFLIEDYKTKFLNNWNNIIIMIMIIIMIISWNIFT